MNGMAKKSKKHRGSNDDAKEEPTATGGEGNGGAGPNFSHLVSPDADPAPPEVPDLCIPPLKKKKKKRHSSGEAEQSGEDKEKKKNKGSETDPAPPEVLDLCIPPLKKKKRHRSGEAEQSGEDKKKKKSKRSETGPVNEAGGPSVGRDEGGLKEDAFISAGISDTDGKALKTKKRKRERDAVDTGTSVTENELNSTGGGQSNYSGINEVDGRATTGQEASSSGSDAIVIKKVKKKKQRIETTPEETVGDIIVENSGRDFGLPESDASPPKKKRKKEKHKNDCGSEIPEGDVGDGEQEASTKASANVDASPLQKKKKKHRNYSGTESPEQGVGKSIFLKSPEPAMSLTPRDTTKKKKTVRFQEPEPAIPTSSPPEENMEDIIEYFSTDRNWKKDGTQPGLVYGRFTKEEDKKIKKSVFDYVKMHGWHENEGLQMVLNSSRHPEARGCWLQIAKCLPARPVKQINSRAISILSGEKTGKWSEEDVEELKKLHELHGNNWKKIGFHLGRRPQLCKDKWRHMRLGPELKGGVWAQEELDKLSTLVRRSLRVKSQIPKKGLDRRQLRDDVNWEWISEQMNRDSADCADQWYSRLASPMVWMKIWQSKDDRLLLQRLMELGAASEEAVDWDTVLDHRNGDVCIRRWKEMTKVLGRKDHASFEEKLELMAKRYAPDLLGIEEAE